MLHSSWMEMEGGVRKKKKGRNYGHLKGIEVVQKIVKTSIELNIPVITFYVFSSENWKRPKNERSYLFELIKNYFKKEIKNIVNQGIKINILGEFKKFSSDLKFVLKKTIYLTKKNNKIIVNLAINYGSKTEILNAFKKSKNQLTLKNIERNLYTKNIANPDILIRTGGHQRLSNFLLWQMAYTELFFLKKLWPDFKPKDLLKIIKKYKNIKRNYGNI